MLYTVSIVYIKDTNMPNESNLKNPDAQMFIVSETPGYRGDCFLFGNRAILLLTTPSGPKAKEMSVEGESYDVAISELENWLNDSISKE